ncbi:MAG: CotH kinase family protein [Myxococcota bacterium]
MLRLTLPTLLLSGCGPSIIHTLDPVADTGAPVPDDSGDPIEVLPGDTAPDTVPGGDDDDAIYAAFFDPTVIQTVDLVLSDAAIRTLNRGEDDGYVEGDATINGVFFPSVGVRLKGSSTYQDLDCSDGACKAAFKLKLNEFVEDQRYGDLERVTLNNMTSDYTQSKELIVYDLLHRQSQLASRASYARVTLNGQPWGLYLNIESADDRWLRRRFEDPEGNFWGTASSWGDFYEPWLDTGWVSKSGDGDKERLRALTAALDAYAGDFFGELSPYVNVDQWLDYWAWCAATGNYDGYPFTVNDVLVYADPADGGRFTFAPWGTDESFDEQEYTGRGWNVVSARLGTACLADPACVMELTTHIDAALTDYDATDVLGIAQAAWDLSEDDVLTDPKRPFTPDHVWYYRDYYAGVVPGYSDYVRAKVGL